MTETRLTCLAHVDGRILGTYKAHIFFVKSGGWWAWTIRGENLEVHSALKNQTFDYAYDQVVEYIKDYALASQIEWKTSSMFYPHKEEGVYAGQTILIYCQRYDQWQWALRDDLGHVYMRDVVYGSPEKAKIAAMATPTRLGLLMDTGAVATQKVSLDFQVLY